MPVEERMKQMMVGHWMGKSVLWILSLLYRTGTMLRHYAYDFRLLPSKKVPAVVVSVGNIVAGGTGKTPLVHFLAEELAQKYSVAILSRGYRSMAEKRIHPTRVQPVMTAEEVGDEPLWLAQKLPQVQVWVGVDRYQSAQKAIENGAEILILDDGFQHRRLHRDFDIVVVNGESPFSNGYFLPRGYLRDCPSRLSKATLLVMMGASQIDLSQAPAVTFQRTTSLDLKGKKVALFCAIANPQRFIHQVESAGAHITVSSIKPDHAPFSIEEIEALVRQSQAELLICTEKDFVKLPSITTSIPLVAVPMELHIQDGTEAWTQLIKKIQSQVDHEQLRSAKRL